MSPSKEQATSVKSNGHTGKPTVAALAKLKRLPVPFLFAQGLHDIQTGVGITYYHADNKVAGIKRRISMESRNGFRWEKNVPVLAYGLWRLDEARNAGLLYLVEGESDCWALWYHNYPALGIPGANNARVLTEKALAGISTVYVVKEPGQSGDTFIPCVAARLAKLKWYGTAKQIQMVDDCKDPADLHCRFPNHDAFDAAMKRCLAHSLPLPKAVRTSALTTKDSSSSNGNGSYGANGAPADDAPIILVTTHELAVNNAAAEALGRDDRLFKRAGSLVEYRNTDPDEKPPKIEKISKATLRERLAHVAHWKREVQTEEKSYPRSVHPPEWSTAAVYDRGDWPNVRRLKAVVEYPVLLPSGEVLSKPGYDAASEIVLEWPHKALAVPDKPNRQQVTRAVDSLEEVVRDFPFATVAYQSAWYAALLTPLARFAIAGPAPLFLVDANTRGSGKGLLLKSIFVILTGREPAVTPYPETDDNRQKLLTTLALGGARHVFLDNVTGRFGDPMLDAALTATFWSDRMFGTQKDEQVPMFASWYVTGNNLQVVADTGRRILPIRLESRVEKPETRSGFDHPDLLAWVKAERFKLLAAALTILRGYTAAGKPDQKLVTWGSFEAWTRLIRHTLVWAGLPDPRTAVEEGFTVVDHEATLMTSLLKVMQKLDPMGRGLKTTEILGQVAHLYDAELHGQLRNILVELMTQKKLEPLHVGILLGKYRRRILDGLFVDQKTIRGDKHWVVLAASQL